MVLKKQSKYLARVYAKNDSFVSSLLHLSHFHLTTKYNIILLLGKQPCREQCSAESKGGTIVPDTSLLCVHRYGVTNTYQVVYIYSCNLQIYTYTCLYLFTYDFDMCMVFCVYVHIYIYIYIFTYVKNDINITKRERSYCQCYC